MKLAIIGATGGTGRELVTQTLAAGNNVQALVRDPARLPISDEKLTITQGDVLDPAAVSATLSGADAVIVSLGVTNNSPSDICSSGTQVVVDAMKTAGISRLIVITSLGIGDSKGQVPFAFKMLARTVFKKAMVDKDAQEDIVRGSGLDWTIIRPGGLTNGAKTGNYKSGLDRSIVAGQVSRADVAAFTLSQVNDDTYLHQTPAIT